MYTAYKNIVRKMKIEFREAKNKWIAEQCIEIERLEFRYDPKNVKQEKWCIHDDQGNPIINQEEQKNCLKVICRRG